MATFRKRGNRWYAEVRRRGVEKRASFPNKTMAKKWAEDIEDAIDSGAALERHTLHDAFKKYAREVSPKKRGARWELLRLDKLARDMPDKPIDRVTPADIATWRDKRLKEVKSSSVRRDFVLLTSLFNVAVREWRWLTRAQNPIQDVTKPPAPPSREQLISDGQAKAVMLVAGYRRGMQCVTKQQLTAAGLDFALETAMRMSEITGLTWSNIDLDQRFVTLPMTKNGTCRQVPLSRGAIEILKSLEDHEPEPFAVTSASLSAIFRKLVARAGLSGQFTFHDSRATAITRLAHKLEIYDLARLTGHKDLKQLQKYYRATAADIARRLD